MRAWTVWTTVARTVFVVAFGAGSVIHLVWGRLDPAAYGAFADTAWGPLADLWRGWVMPRIGWLSVVTAVLEAAVAAGLVVGGRVTRGAAAAACGFFVFLLFLGYGLPRPTTGGHIIVNQLGSLVMLAAMSPAALGCLQPLPQAWRAVLARRGAASADPVPPEQS